jgi:N-acetylglucosaminyldiphosphoundecaprenol N-acetyl-beta-D-mannosaminyltransferase
VTPTVRLLGLDFADLSGETVLAWLMGRPADAPFDYLVTPNADHLVRLGRDTKLAAVYRDAALCLLDSRVVARAALLLGLRVPFVVTGSDLTMQLLRRLGEEEQLTIVGLSPRFLSRLTTGWGIAPPAHYDPPMGFENDPAAMARVVRFVLRHPARFVVLAVGSPRQERLAAAIKATGAATGFGLCVGASLDYLAGVTPRAPDWMQIAGLEWLHRLVCDPRRLAKRYLFDDMPIFAMLLRQRLAESAIA